MNRSPTDMGLVDTTPGYCADHDWIECWDCGGEGTYSDMCECERIEDICCCAEPTPARCSTCRGKGGWPSETGKE